MHEIALYTDRLFWKWKTSVGNLAFVNIWLLNSAIKRVENPSLLHFNLVFLKFCQLRVVFYIVTLCGRRSKALGLKYFCNHGQLAYSFSHATSVGCASVWVRLANWRELSPPRWPRVHQLWSERWGINLINQSSRRVGTFLILFSLF